MTQIPPAPQSLSRSAQFLMIIGVLALVLAACVMWVGYGPSVAFALMLGDAVLSCF